MRVIIFSGTTEGRQISERLSGVGIEHIVCVATGYGELVMQPDPYADIRQGRLDADEMRMLIEGRKAVRGTDPSTGGEPALVFDATHPYVASVSENIRSACEMTGAEYVRIIRGGGKPAETEGLRIFDNAASCAEALAETEGNILLTTGSKDLQTYTADPEVRKRLFVRVLPSEESIRLCSEAGICGRQVIAMQGPFSMDLDLAIIRQFDIRVLVTKASGKAGGFDEKLQAASAANIPVYIIGRPTRENGISVSEALGKYFGLMPSVRIDLIGTGPGDVSFLTREAEDAIREADLIFGAERMIAPYSGRESYPYYLAKDIIPVICEKLPQRIAVLFSGDTGFYSGASKMRTELGIGLDENGFESETVMHPGISVFSYLTAKVGVPYQDAAFRIMHG